MTINQKLFRTKSPKDGNMKSKIGHGNKLLSKLI